MNAVADVEDAIEFPEFRPILPRSQLYSLEPMAVGTGMVESLTSYIARLAEAHSLKLSILVKKIVAPLSTLKGMAGISGHNDMLRNLGASLNGAGTTSAECVRVLEALTLQRRLQELTLRFTNGWLSDGALVSKRQKWCSKCLHIWKRDGTTMYYPLLWQLQIVQFCPVHEQHLVSDCPQCGAWHRPLGKHLIPGHCPACGAWLGAITGHAGEDEGLRQVHQFVANQSQALLAAASTFENCRKTAWPRNIDYLVQQHAGGVAHRLSQDLGIDHYTVGCWIRNVHVPTLPSALMVAYAFGLDVVDLLSSILVGEVRLVRPLKTAPELITLFRRKLKRHDLNALVDILTQAAERPADPPLSLMAICKKVGCHQSYASRKFPVLTKKIVEHHRTYWRIHKQQRQYFAGLITKSVASQLAASGQYPSHGRMKRALPSWISLRDASAKKAWLETLGEWGWKKADESVH